MKIKPRKTGIDISIDRYKHRRQWGVWVNGKLLAVTVYKKGAFAIRETILDLAAKQ